MHGIYFPKYRNCVYAKHDACKPGETILSVDDMQQVAYMLEREMVSMDLSKGVEQHTLIIDFKGYSIFNRPPMSVTKYCIYRYPLSQILFQSPRFRYSTTLLFL